MRQAIGLALKAEGMTSPNPIVGAVVVKDDRIIGRGYHKKAGFAHAEIAALGQARRLAAGATLYVTLEPCDHFGRTPPCTDAIIKSGIKKVVIGMKDPNPLNNGKGIRRLRRHGMIIKTGVLEKASESINKPYIKFITKRMPYITIKVGQSLDGKIATKTGDSRWITSDDSRRYVHKLRQEADAVMVGVNTVIKDNPLLTNRISSDKQPVRIIVDAHLKTPLNSRIFSDIGKSPVYIATVKRDPRISRYEEKGAKVLIVKSKDMMVDLRDLLKTLGKMDIVRIMVEGGGELIASLIEEGLADHFLFFIAPKIIGGRSAKTSVEGRGIARVKDAAILRGVKVRRFKEDILIEAEAR